MKYSEWLITSYSESEILKSIVKLSKDTTNEVERKPEVIAEAYRDGSKEIES